MRTGRGRDISKEEAHRRAVEDYSQFSQYARNSAQFAFTANGGAAGAILTFLTAIITSQAVTNPAISNVIDPKIIIWNFAISSSFYLAGLLFSVVAMFLYSLSKENSGHAWEDTVATGHIDYDSYFARKSPSRKS